MDQRDRRRIVLELLEHWPDLHDIATSDGTLTTGGAASTSPSSTAVLSSMSRHPAVLELERCLIEIRNAGPRHFSAVVAYFDAPVRNVDRDTRRRLPSGTWTRERRRVRERVLPRELQRYPVCKCNCGMPQPVCLAVDVVCGLWKPTVTLELPRGLIAKVRVAVDAETGQHVFTQATAA